MLSLFLSYSKVLNFSLGAYLTLAAYLIWEFVEYGWSFRFWGMSWVFFATLFLIHWSLQTYFPHQKKREKVWLIITLALSVLIESIIGLAFGPITINISIFSLAWWQILSMLFFATLALYYFYQYSIVGKQGIAISENEYVARGVGISHRKHSLMSCLFISVLMFIVAGILISHSSLKVWDGFFYIVKGLGIMILAGVAKKEYIYLAAFLYVSLEYLCFVLIWLPLTYKEPLILILILLLLLFKPEGLFSRTKRTL